MKGCHVLLVSISQGFKPSVELVLLCLSRGDRITELPNMIHSEPRQVTTPRQ